MPDNASYFHAAYAVAIAVYGLYAFSLWRRRAKVRDALRREARAD
jgi:hypothetical protein